MKDTFQTGAGILVATCGGLQHCAAKRSLKFTDTNAAMDTRVRLVEFLCENQLVVVAHAGEYGFFFVTALICVLLGLLAVCGILVTPAFDSQHRRRTWWFSQVIRLRCSL